MSDRCLRSDRARVATIYLSPRHTLAEIDKIFDLKCFSLQQAKFLAERAHGVVFGLLFGFLLLILRIGRHVYPAFLTDVQNIFNTLPAVTLLIWHTGEG